MSEAIITWSSAIVSGILALAVLSVIWVGYLLRKKPKNGSAKGKGIGWQFIRYTVIGIAIPIAGVLALHDALSGSAAAIISGALGYAFGQQGTWYRPPPRSIDQEPSP